MKYISSFILRLFGWTIIHDYPHHIKKKILVAAPHTSYVDFFVGVMVRSSMQLESNFIGKQSLFWPPLGWLMKAWGGVPVDRSKNNNFVDSVVEVFNAREEFTILFAAEGTRKRVEKFRTGFYYIAKLAKVPIIPVVFDYKKKEVTFLKEYYPTEDVQLDLETIEGFFAGVEGYYKEKSFRPHE